MAGRSGHRAPRSGPPHGRQDRAPRREHFFRDRGVRHERPGQPTSRSKGQSTRKPHLVLRPALSGRLVADLSPGPPDHRARRHPASGGRPLPPPGASQTPTRSSVVRSPGGAEIEARAPRSAGVTHGERSLDAQLRHAPHAPGTLRLVPVSAGLAPDGRRRSRADRRFLVTRSGAKSCPARRH